jgi:hypothetical protein
VVAQRGRTLVGMDEATDSTAATPAYPAHAGLTYAALRVLLLLVTGAVLYLVGMRGVMWLLATVLVSAGLSFFVLLRQREAAARSLEAGMAARSARRRAASGAGDEPPPEHGG